MTVEETEPARVLRALQRALGAAREQVFTTD